MYQKMNDLQRLVITLFNEYDKDKEFASGGNGPRLIWTTNSSTFSINKNSTLELPHGKELTVDNDPETIQEIYDKYGVIQMRKYSGETTLVLGCGSAPIFFGNTPTRQEYMKERVNRSNYWVKFGKKHQHPNCYSINPDIGMNPSIVGQFGLVDLSFLPAGSFDRIWFEGFMMDCYKDEKTGIIHTENKNSIKTLIYLLKEGGIVAVNKRDILIKTGDKLSGIDKQPLLFADDTPESYYFFYEIR